MLIEPDYKNKRNSKFFCDSCKTQLSIETKIAIYVGLPARQPKKKYDLCKKCYKSFVRGVEKE